VKTTFEILLSAFGPIFLSFGCLACQSDWERGALVGKSSLMTFKK
jgi:hypothetical protein